VRKEKPVTGTGPGTLKKHERKTQARKPRSERVVATKYNPADDDFVLTKAQLRELDRRVADMKDPVRYLIESRFTPKFRLFYNVSDDVYAMNNPTDATLFKRRNAALAVRKLLGGRTLIIRCTTRRRKGQVIPVLPSLQGPSETPGRSKQKVVS
jgi:hypothetical protein